MEDTNPPIIKSNDITLNQDKALNIRKMNLTAYDVMNGKLNSKVVTNNIDSTQHGNYSIVGEATDQKDLITKFFFTVSATNAEVVREITTQVEPQTVALDGNNLNVRGWTILANDSRVSDTTIRSYMN